MNDNGSGRRRLLVGIVTHTDVAALYDTLDAVDRAVRATDSIVLVPDGADAAMAEALRTHERLLAFDQWGSDAPRGNAAAFNRIAAGRSDDTGAIVFLESGARPASDSFDRLASALDRPQTGLAGPSTNDAWNEQCAVPDGGGDPRDLIATAALLAERFGDVHRSLWPLYSISDVCFAVSSETLDAVGAADEGFGLGPCWEMEYAARAARTGLAAVWVCAAYVHRAAVTSRRRHHDLADLPMARHRYQDRLCGLRLSGRRAGHSDHCTGDTCREFAPAERIVVYLPLRGSDRTPQPRSAPTTQHASPAAAPAVAVPCPTRRGTDNTVSSGRARGVAPEATLVSCVMPTADRPEWVARSVRYFQRQNHQRRELVIVDDGAIDLRDELGADLDDPRIRYVRGRGPDEYRCQAKSWLPEVDRRHRDALGR